MRGSAAVEHRNEVAIVGRVTGAPSVRTLPSGDDIVTWRVSVDRDPARVRGESTSRRVVDALDCVAWAAAARRSALACAENDVVEVVGSLRRRFWRTGSVPVSRCEVEAVRVRRLQRAG